MNSAVEPLLKAINDLSEKVSTLEVEKGDLLRRINALESSVRDLQSSTSTNNYRWNTTINTNTTDSLPSAYGYTATDGVRLSAQSYVSDFNSNNDGTFTLTYSDGRTVTIGN